jgi:hypothetical protein
MSQEAQAVSHLKQSELGRVGEACGPGNEQKQK